jgi:hypothetical protein
MISSRGVQTARRIVWATWLSLAAACGQAAESSRKNDSDIAATRAITKRQPDPITAYWSDDVSHEVPWLIYFDSSSNVAALYEPLRPLAICDFQLGADQHVSFHTGILGGGTFYQFSGVLAGEHLNGSVKQVRRRTGTVEDSFPLSVRKIRARLLSGASDSLSGVYSRFEKTEGQTAETGDIFGSEILLIDATEGIVGIRVDWAGGVNEIFSATGKLMGDTLQLSEKSNERTDRESFLVHGDTLTYIQTGHRLVRNRRVPDVFRASDLEPCAQ